ncbi:MAG: insulinase family protein [Candidatus Cloacimonetes bacterium]|nr:insulinase family protein [Candidatus Cloacimonadota bacterium]
MVNNATRGFTLPNGFKIIYTPDKGRPIVSLQIYVRVGSVWERENEAGFSHFMEHLVFKSTAKYPANRIMDIASGLGASINAYTEYDSTCFYLTVPSEFLAEGMDLLAELVKNPNFSDEDFKSEKKVVIEELKQYQNDPEENFVEAIPALYFKHNPYRNPIVGNQESLKNSTPEDLRKFFSERYTPDNCFIVVTGDFDEENLKKVIDTFFLDWNASKSVDVKIEPEACPEEFRYCFKQSKLRKDIIAITLPELSDLHPDAYSLNLAMKVFASGKNSILYKRLYNEEKLIDTVKLYSFSGKIDGVAAIVIFPKHNKDIEKIFRIFLEELSKLSWYGLSDETIRKHRVELEHSYRYSFEFVETLGSVIGSEELLGDYQNLYSYLHKTAEINAQSVRKVIDEIINIKYLQLMHTGKTALDTDAITAIYKEFNILSDTQQQPTEFEEIQLSNGIVLMMKKVIGKPTVGIAATFNASQLNEPEKYRGINQFTAAMLQFGNIKRDHESLLEYCIDNGISLSCDPMMDCTVIKVKSFNDRLAQAIEILADVLEKPTFPMEHIKQYRQTCISSLDRMKDYPASIAYRQFKQYLFGSDSNFVGSLGEKKHLQIITRNQLLDWYAKYYQKAPLYISIVGNIDFKEVKALFEKQFKQKRKPINLRRRLTAHTPAKRTKIVTNDETQAVIYCGGKACTISEREYNTAFFVLSQIIGGEMNSRLFNLLREKHGLAYSVSFDVHSYKDFGYYAINCITDRENDKFAIELIKQVLSDIVKNGVTEEELRVARNYIKGQRLIGEESMMSQAKILSYLRALGYDYQYYLERDKRLESVTCETMQQLAKEYLNEDNFYTYIYK